MLLHTGHVCVTFLRCVELLKQYYSGRITRLDSDDEDEEEEDDEEGGEGGAKKGKAAKGKAAGGDGGASTLLTEKVTPRQGLPPLLTALVDRPPERLHYLGAHALLRNALA